MMPSCKNEPSYDAIMRHFYNYSSMADLPRKRVSLERQRGSFDAATANTHDAV